MNPFGGVPRRLPRLVGVRRMAVTLHCMRYWSSAARQGLHQYDLVGGKERVVEIVVHCPVDEDSHVLPETALFVDHSEADARVPAIEVIEQLSQRRSVGVDFADTVGVGAQRCRDPWGRWATDGDLRGFEPLARRRVPRVGR